MTNPYGPPVGALIGPPDTVFGPPASEIQMGPPVTQMPGPPVPS